MPSCYFSHSWREPDREITRFFFRLIRQSGFDEVIGDIFDRSQEFDTSAGQKRIERIMSTCNAFVAVCPRRERIAGTKWYNTSMNILKEIRLTKGKPGLIFAEDCVSLQEDFGVDVIEFNRDTYYLEEAKFLNQLEALRGKVERFKPILRDVFVIIQYKEPEFEEAFEIIRNVVDEQTGLPCYRLKDYISVRNIRENILRKIDDAYFVIADISDNSPNCYFEAGLAVAKEAELNLIMRPTKRITKPAFDLNDLQCKMWKNTKELKDAVIEICRPYRRRLIHHEPDFISSIN